MSETWGEGWAKVAWGKWHYFDCSSALRPLCGSLIINRGGILEQHYDDDIDNCITCRRKLAKLKALADQGGDDA